MNQLTHLSSVALVIGALLALVFITSCNSKVPSRSPNGGVSGPAAATQTTTHQATGTVKALDLKASTIEIDHGDIEGLMPAMEMEFSVKNATLLNGISVGDRIDFEITNSVGGLQVTAIKKL